MTPSGRRIWLLLYVDDGLLANDKRDRHLVKRLKELLKEKFDIVEKKVEKFLGMEVLIGEGSIKLSQHQFIVELLHKFGMEDCIPKLVPMDKEQLYPCGEDEDETSYPYAELIGSLLYLLRTRPDIAYAVGALARFMGRATDRHWEVAKGVLRYLKGTMHVGLVYQKGPSSDPILEGYCDSDHASDEVTRKSITGFVFTVNGTAVSWRSHQQTSVAHSSNEAEYVAGGESAREGLWLRTLWYDFNLPLSVVPIKGDNQGMLAQVKNPIITSRSKHIGIQHHFIREKVANGEIQFAYVSTAENLADFLTKPVPNPKQRFCAQNIGLRG